MIRGGFLSDEDRKALIALARDGSEVCRVTRRANALVLLDDGMSCQEVAKVLLFDDDTIRGWRELFEQGGIEGLTSFDMGGSSSKMSAEQAEALKAWVTAALPRSTRHVGAWIAKEFGLVYESRCGLIALLHRLGLEYHKPEVISRKLDEKTQKAFIAGYENLLNSMAANEVAVFMDAVHPTHAARPVGCWAPKQQNLAIEQTSGRERINIHGAIDLETGQTRMIEAETVDAISTIRLLESLELLYPLMVCIHVPGQRALSSRQTRERMAVAAGMPDQATLPTRLLPASEPDRAVMGRHAQEHHAQQNLWHLQRIRRSDLGVPARQSPSKLGQIP
jgi:transposase